MLDILNSFYNILIDKYSKYNDGIVFSFNSHKYYFVKVDSNLDVNHYYLLSLYLKDNGFKAHDFVFNKHNELISDGYVLFRINSLKDEISIEDINLLNRICIDMNFEYISMWEFWYKKLDYIENQVKELSSFKCINYSIDYFLGVGELLINFLKNNFSTDKICYVHKSFDILNPLDFYNPFNIMVGDYYKDIVSFIRLKREWNLFSLILDNCSYTDRVYIFVRMCFPFCYFDSVSDVILNGKDDASITILNDVPGYERYLSYIEDICDIRLFYWIKKE